MTPSKIQRQGSRAWCAGRLRRGLEGAPLAKWEETRIHAVVASVVAAGERARFVFLALNITSLIVILATFNAAYNWSSNVEQERVTNGLAACIQQHALLDQGEPKDGKPSAAPADIARCEQVKATFDTVTKLNWNEYNSVSIPVIGARVGTDDIDIAGSIALLVLVTWWWYVLRRENHSMRSAFAIFDQAMRGEPRRMELANYVETVARGASVFTSVTREGEGTVTGPLARFSLLVLRILPFLTILSTIANEWLSLFQDSSLVPHHTLKQDLQALSNDDFFGLFARIEPTRMFEFYWHSAVAVVCLALVVAALRGCFRWSSRTKSMLVAMRDQLRAQNPDVLGDVSANPDLI